MMRYAGNLFEFGQYYGVFGAPFHLPYPIEHDPTERNYLSNRLGKAIADYLCKDIYKAKYTHSYEGAMYAAGHPLIGERPDFYCDTGTQTFAVEAKGFTVTSVSDNKMMEHKAQSTSGPLLVNFSVASVAYDLYRNPKVKFYDPPSDDARYDKNLNLMLRTTYYRSILEFIKLSGWFEAEPSVEGAFDRFRSVQRGRRIDIILSKGIYQGAWQDVGWTIDSEKTSDEGRYVDLDGVGLALAMD